MTNPGISFPLGQLLATPRATQTLAKFSLTPLHLIARHQRGDWGDISAEDQKANESAIADGSRIFSAYQLPDGSTVWVITDAADERGNRPATCVLLPDE